MAHTIVSAGRLVPGDTVMAYVPTHDGVQPMNPPEVVWGIRLAEYGMYEIEWQSGAPTNRVWHDDTFVLAPR